MHDLSGKTEHRLLATATEFRRTPEDTFVLKLPNAPEVDAALGRLASRSGPARPREEE